MSHRYTGRFAPSPTGALHAGSLVAALASWLDARAWNQGQGGRWLIRIEDVDQPRCIPKADQTILQQLSLCGLHPDAPPVWQSQRHHLYQQALDQLVAHAQAYPCTCSRKDIEAAWAARGLGRMRNQAMPYPGTCRQGLLMSPGQRTPAWRFCTEPASSIPSLVCWHDRRLGAQQQDVAQRVGDFVLRRADGLWAYQLAVVVDDAAQGVTHIVRGEDLADNTPRQIMLQRALGLPLPQYLHTSLVIGTDGEKLSKQNGAQALQLDNPLAALNQAAAVLGLHQTQGPVAHALQEWVRAWQNLYNLPP